MATFDRERAKAELGWDDKQIDAYLASPQAKADSARVATPQAAPSKKLGPLDMMAALDVGLFRSEMPGFGAGQLAAKSAPLLLGGAGVAGAARTAGPGIVAAGGQAAKIGAKRALGQPIGARDLEAFVRALFQKRAQANIAETLGNSVNWIR